MSVQPLRKGSRIPCLHEHCARPRELADETFARADARYDAARRRALEDVLAVPSDEVAVVNDVFLTWDELWLLAWFSSRYFDHAEQKNTFILTSFRMIAPKLVIHTMPLPLILYTNSPSPLKTALPSP